MGYFRKGREDVNFDDIFSTNRSFLATYVNSSGFISWAPHNLLSHSEDFENPIWSKIGTNSITSGVLAPNGTNTATRISSDNTFYLERSDLTIDSGMKCGIWIRSVSGIGNITVCNTSKLITSDWELVYSDLSSNLILLDFRTSDLFDVEIWGAHVIRTDLNGMGIVPLEFRGYDVSNSYIKTDATPKFLTRRNSYIHESGELKRKGILLETKERTNFVEKSSDFSHSSWMKESIKILAHNILSPSNEYTAQKLVAGSSQITSHNIRTSYSNFVLESYYSISVFVKSSEYFKLKVSFQNTEITFDLKDLTHTPNSLARIEEYSDGWYRIFLTAKAIEENSDLIFYLVDKESNTSFVGDNISGIYLWGCQIEEGEVSSYIPDILKTRNSDAYGLVIDSSITSIFSPEFSLNLVGSFNYLDNNNLIDVVLFKWQSDSNNQISVFLDTKEPSTSAFSSAFNNDQYFFSSNLADFSNDFDSMEYSTLLPVDLFTGTMSFSKEVDGLEYLIKDEEKNVPGYDKKFIFSTRQGSDFFSAALDGQLLLDVNANSNPDLSSSNVYIGFSIMGYISYFRMWLGDIGVEGILESSIGLDGKEIKDNMWNFLNPIIQESEINYSVNEHWNSTWNINS